MEIESYRNGEETVIRLQGRLDAAWSGHVNQALQDIVHSGCHQVALDLAELSYLSSAGIRVLVMLAKQLQGIDGQLRLLAVSPTVESVLNLVGFSHLLAARTTARSEAPVEPRQELTSWSGPSGVFQYSLLQNDVHPARLRLIGDPEAVLQGQASLYPAHRVSLTSDACVIGLGAIGNPGSEAQLGELLAVSGVAMVRPASDHPQPDWLASEGELSAQLNLAYGCHAQGGFSHFLRFGEGHEIPALAISDLSNSVLQLCNSDCALMVVIAETASLVGAGLQRAPEQISGDWFEFPALRDHLVFTAEPAYHQEACLIAGIVARQPAKPLAAFLRPLTAATDGLMGHLHAAVMPYRPVPKGIIPLRENLDHLLENQIIHDILHLLNDDREGVGSGQSYLQRGAVWCVSLQLEGDQA